MDFEQQGVYVFLLDHQWLNGSIPSDPEEIRLLLRMEPEHFERVWKRVEPCFALADGRLVNPRMARDQIEYEEFCESRRKAAKSRWKGSKKQPQSKRNARAVQVECSPVSRLPSANSSENSNSPHIPPLPPAGDAEIPENLSVCWKEWLAYRRERKLPVFKPITIRKQIAFLAAQPDPAACVNQSILNGWQGLFELKASPNQASRPDEIEAMKARLRAEGYQ